MLAEFGVRDAVSYAVYRLLGRSGGWLGFYRYVFHAQPVAAVPRVPPRRAAGLPVRRLSPGDPALAALGLDAAAQAHRFGQGAVCLAAFRGEEPLGCIWLCLGPFREDEVRCRFEPLPAGTACWDLGVFVRPEHRAGFAFARLWDAADAFLRERGVRWSVSRISAFNPASRRAHERLGARPVGTASFLCLGPVQLTVSSLRPFPHLSLRRDRLPVLRPPVPELPDPPPAPDGP
ncbi:GNAT family N-acetyltransferase [Rhodocista pekingensis]|uniref:GNAT family N-acetyltransferase n=1 Tax=Rhodocista pekingensis TaxID=201185 RepID=A0ABW2KZ02_9PROT